MKPDLSIRLTLDQPRQALKAARRIDDHGSKCCALAWVGRYWPDKDYHRILEEAFTSAYLQDDPFKQVTISAWPIRAYLERGDATAAREHLVRNTRVSSAIENMGSRSTAILSIFEASKPFSLDLWQPVFWALVGASEPALSWRQRRNLRHAVAMVASDQPEIVQDVLKTLSDQKSLSKIRRYLDKLGSKHSPPRPFFDL